MVFSCKSWVELKWVFQSDRTRLDVPKLDHFGFFLRLKHTCYILDCDKVTPLFSVQNTNLKIIDWRLRGAISEFRFTKILILSVKSSREVDGEIIRSERGWIEWYSKSRTMERIFYVINRWDGIVCSDLEGSIILNFFLMKWAQMCLDWILWKIPYF